MRMNTPTSMTVGLLTILVALGAFDALLIENDRLLAQRQPPGETDASSSTSSISSTGEGTRKITGPNVLDILFLQNFTVVDPTKERSLVEQIIPSDVATIQTKVLMKDDDRIGLIAWTESPQVKIYFLALKEALHSTFSPEMHDLIDEVQEQPGRPTRNLLTFVDPTINEERIVFVRVRERLYEFHVAEGHDDTVFELVEALTN